MDKICNFVDPENDIINRINIYNFTSPTQYKYLISELPHKSADILCIASSYLEKIHRYKEFQYIPYIVYGDEQHIEKSFIIGASDYIKNPWSFSELELRSARFIIYDKLKICKQIINFSNNSISSNKLSLDFTVNEYKILSILANNQDKIISRENIYYKLGIKNSDSRVIDVYLNSIRKKISQLLEDCPDSKDIIKTIRGKGYSINSQYTCG